MPLSVETAVVSKKGSQYGFNTDAVNAAGKLWDHATLHSDKGVRAAGSCTDRPFYVLASSKTKGTAESAVELFQNCVEKFDESGSNCSQMISEYLNAFSRVLNETGFDSSDCAFSILAGFNDTVYVAKSADSRIYTYYDENFLEIHPLLSEFADNKSAFGVAQCNHVKAGDVFILVNSAVGQALPDSVMEAICKSSGGDIKKIAALISSQAAKLGAPDAISAIVTKIKSATPVSGEGAFEQTPADIAAGTGASLFSASDFIGSPENNEIPLADDEDDDEPRKKKRGGKIFLIILLAIALLAGLFFGVKAFSEWHSNNEDTTASSTESTTAPTETTTKKAPETTTKPTTTKESTTAESTTAATTEATATTAATTARATTTYYYDDDDEEDDTTEEADDTTEAPRPTEEPSSSETPSEDEPSVTEDEPTSEEPTDSDIIVEEPDSSEESEN